MPLAVAPLEALQSGRRLSDWILSQTGGNQPHIDPLKPIHFIGHSAGGFCMGEAATRLKDRNVVVDRVTILDTPVPIYQHIIAQRYPGYLDRYVSSLYGLMEAPYPLPPIPDQDHSWNGSHIKGLQYLLSTGDNGHGYSHVWYQTTIDQDLSDGFSRSPVLRWPKRR